ncbi:bifunctional DNA-formamidopyrimidine glycosylase/DNA-(apurinic or apyrimidinic site) lyase [Patescibacteria group bacterium]|nr:bifunctional DNA-formamidopyrimidine glycosylase/DNA-(apurinic or apyrimidinic site) lyase [Patescibacteria group bacterium]
MPELPEVETVVRGLSRHIVGQRVKHIHIPAKNSFKGTAKKAEGLSIKKITRRGKGIIIELAKPGVARKSEDGSNSLSLLIHLKMTGQLIYVPASRHAEFSSASKSKILKRVQDDGRLNFGHPTDDFTNTMPSKHTRVIFELTPTRLPAHSLTRSSNFLYFNDQRRFGWVKLTPTKDVPKDKFFAGLGLEPLDKKFTPTFLYDAIKRRPKSNIKAIILDQTLITGLGNIYSNEALFYARILPTRLGKTIKKPEATKLHSAIQKVLRLGIKHSGTSIANYRSAEGALGNMQKYLTVYGRKGLPCHGCKGTVKAIHLNGRSAYFCPSCQK